MKQNRNSSAGTNDAQSGEADGHVVSSPNAAKPLVSCRNNFYDDEDCEDDDDFQCCADCDLPDACADFGCAIKQGIIKPWWYRNYGS